MQTKIISCYKSKDSKVIVITKEHYYVYPIRLKNEKCEELISKVKTAGHIETSRWKLGEE